MKRRALLGVAVMLVAAAPEGPEAPIAAFNAGLLAGMKSGPAVPFATRAAALAPLMERAFDLRAILQASVGPGWNRFSAAQQADILAAFRAFTVATWVANFDSFVGETLELLPGGRKVGNDEVIATRIVPPTGAATRLDYVMRQGPAGWQAVDILVDGAISRVAVQRSDFRTLLKDGDPAPLIANLRDRAAGLAGTP